MPARTEVLRGSLPSNMRFAYVYVALYSLVPVHAYAFSCVNK